MDFDSFQQCLANTSNAEKAIRDPAEDALKQYLQRDPNALAVLLMQGISDGHDAQIKQAACVLFRNFLTNVVDPKLSLWSTTSLQTKELLKQHLLQAIRQEPNSFVRRNIKNCVHAMATHLSYEWSSLEDAERAQTGHFWPELLVMLWEFAQSANPEMRETALLILSDVPQAFGDQIERYLQSINELLQASLSTSAPLPCQVAAAKAFTGFICYGLEKKEHRLYLAPLLQHAVAVAVAALQAGETKAAEDALESLIELAEARPKFFRQSMPMVIENMTNIAAAAELDDGIRRLAIEVLLELCEQADNMVRKFEELPQKLVPIFLNMIMEYEHDDNWSKIDADDTGDDDSNSTFGEQSLDRLCLSVKGGAIIPVIFQYLPQMLSDQQRWQSRAAALTAIAAIGEGCHDQMQNSLKDIVDQVAPRLLDPHPRVRYTACDAIGQLSIDFAAPHGKEHKQGFQLNFHSTVIPALLTMMQDTENPRVQAHGAAALINFCERAHRKVLEDHLPSILQRLAEMLSSGYRIVLEQTITALATVADTSRELFSQFYQHFMPQLKHILATPPRDAEWRTLRGRTMECITLIGLAVKKEMFAPDVPDVMKALALTQQNAENDPDDPQISYVLAAWARICEVLEDDFVEYLPVVIPPLLRSVQLQPDVQVIESDTFTDDSHSWELIPVSGSRQIGIKTSILEEKKTACDMLRIYAQQMRGSFAPYIEEVVPIVRDLLVFIFDEDVRSCAASIVPMLLSSAMIASNGDVNKQKRVCGELWAIFSNDLIAAIQDEGESEVVAWQVEALKDCIDNLGAPYLTEEIAHKIHEMIFQYMDEYSGRCDSRKSRRTTDEDFDVESESLIVEEEKDELQVIKEIAGLVRSLFSTLEHRYAVPFQALMPHVVGMLHPHDRPASDHQWGLCMLDDLIETCGEASFPLVQPCLEYFIGYLGDREHPEVVQAAAYGIGIMAKCGGQSFVGICKQALPALTAIVEHPDARLPSNVDATENALSAIVKIVRIESLGIPLVETLPKILQWLPITNDEEEAEYVYTYLLDLIRGRNEVIFQEANLVRTIQVFAAVVGTFVADTDDENGTGSMILMTLIDLETQGGILTQLLPRIDKEEHRAKLMEELQKRA